MEIAARINGIPAESTLTCADTGEKSPDGMSKGDVVPSGSQKLSNSE